MQRFTILEGWRALLAWWVVLSHTLALSGYSRNVFIDQVRNSEVTGFDIGGWFMHLWYEIILLAHHGKIPVYVFVMMSGFVIVHLLIMKKEPYGIYIMRRFLRLWPALMFVLVLSAIFYVAGQNKSATGAFDIVAFSNAIAMGIGLLLAIVLSFAAIGALFQLVRGQTPTPVNLVKSMSGVWIAYLAGAILFALVYAIPHIGQVRAPDNFWGHFFLEATMFHGLVPNEVFDDAAHAISGPGWSISLEWQFYIVAPFILAAMTKGGWRGVLFVTALFGALFFQSLNEKSLTFMGVVYNWNHPAALPHLMGFFGLGMASYYLFRKVGESPERPMFPIIAIIAAAFLTAGFRGSEGGTVPMVIWAIIFGSLITSGTWVHKIIDSKLLHWFGNMSYSTYITHMFVLNLMHRYYIRQNFENQTVGKFIATVVITYPIIIVISIVCYYWIEKPMIEVGRKLAKRMAKKPVSTPPVSPGLTAP